MCTAGVSHNELPIGAGLTLADVVLFWVCFRGAWPVPAPRPALVSPAADGR
jgi:hypothetical protein